VQTNLFLVNQQAAYINVDQTNGKIYFENMDLNTSLIEMGVQPGDTLVAVNGTEASLENFRQILPQSFQWTPDTELTLTINRNGKDFKLQGVVGTPLYPQQKLQEVEDATDEQIQLRNWWLEK
jgi:S1-C subfamily serine protease